MALFTDGPMSSAEELRRYESLVLDVAHTEGIELAAKIELAQRGIAVELAAFLLSRGVVLAQDRKLRNVVVTDALLQWHSLHALALIYRDAYNSQLNDRYLGKWKEYAKLSDRAQGLLYDTGVGMSTNPLPKPQPPAGGTTTGGNMPDTTYFLRVAWQDAQGFTGAMGEPTVVQAAAGQLPMVAVTETAPPAAIGFVVFAGLSDSEAELQTAAPLAPGSTWTMAEAGMVTGLAPVKEQTPDAFVMRRRDFLRG